MAKLTLQADETRLKQKLAAKPSADEKADDTAGGAMLRGLRKQLKRVQRKRRRLALRKQHAGKQPAAASQTAGA